MSRLRDSQDIGFMVLQDHDDSKEIDLRHMLVGARENAPDDDGDGLIQIAAEGGLGTLGDIHPWRYWAPESREKRPMGAWSQAFGAVVVKGSGSRGPVTPSESGPGDSVTPASRATPGASEGGGPATVQARPIRFDDYEPDRRFRAVEHSLPEGMAELPVGTLCIAVAGTEERSQENLLFPVDSRLIDPNWKGPGSMGTIVADLEPYGEISRERIARLQSTWRVVRMPDSITGLNKGPGYGLAWQLGGSQQGQLAGFGLCYGRVSGGGSGGSSAPTVTPGDNPNQGHGATSGGGHWGIGAGGVGPGNVPGAGYTESTQGAPGGG